MKKRGEEFHKKRIRRDFLIILVSIFVAALLARSEFFSYIRNFSAGKDFLDSFISGAFFTSVFTTPFSIVAFADIAKSANIFHMAFFGAWGAVLGDLILFLFIKDNLADDVEYVLKAPGYRKFHSIFKIRMFRWLTPLVGALVIASPLPDELGLAMMGLSRMRTIILIPVSFIMNFIGILLIGFAVQAF